MQFQTGLRTALIGSAVVLAACSDGPVAVTPPVASGAPIAASLARCGGSPQQSRGVPMSVNGWPLPTIRVTASFAPTLGLPFNIAQMFNFRPGSGGDMAPCLNSDAVEYGVSAGLDTLTALPLPPGVDEEYWNSLSPREQRAALELAQLMMQLYPGSWSNVGEVIERYLKPKIVAVRSQAAQRANDFQLAAMQSEMLSGAIYGCALYQRFSRDPDWPLSNDQTVKFAVELLTAYAETRFSTAPLRALQYGRNGAIGVGIGYANGYGADCGWLSFNAVPSGRVNLTDPGAGPQPPQGDGGGRLIPRSPDVNDF